ncbi:Rhodanese-like protein [Backusella circina FSU 941]|nr:Rhodanese-like protein [Backusella circina FSU 941]
MLFKHISCFTKVLFGQKVRFLHSTSLFRPLAFYAIVPIAESRTIVLREILERDLKNLGVVGRIYLAPSQGIGGINCQMAVPIHQIDNVKAYFSSLQPDFGRIEYNKGMQDTPKPFSKLRVVLKKNLVAVRSPMTIEDCTKQPHHLTPEQWHNELKEKNEPPFLLDMRNQYEYDVGRFDHAIKMHVDTFREGMELLDELVQNKGIDEDIYMYCTGGIRCSVAGAYLKNKGFNNVKMLKGGVTAYGHYIKENNGESLYKGKNFTFDGRRGEPITNHVLSQCYHCGNPCDHFTNCCNKYCHLLYIQCDSCRESHSTCSDHCQDVVAGKAKYAFDYDYHRQVQGKAYELDTVTN